jgi:alpha-1,3-rhamnosyltransferase
MVENVMRQPLVTVMVSCYNHEKYIKETIQSVLYQTYKNIQLIVLDDGSKDKSPAILETMSKTHGFYFERQQNMGLNNAMNKMLAMARGEYVVVFGSDDVMMPDRIEKQVAFMQNHPEFDVVGSNVICIDEEGKELPRQRIVPERELTFEDLLLNLKPGIQTPTAMVRARAFQEAGGYDPAIPLEDIYMWLKLSSRGYRFYALADILVHYRKHDSNTYKNIRYMLESLLKTLEPYSHHPLYTKAKNRILISHFLAASKTDASLAWEIFKQIDPSFYSGKVLRGLFKTALTKIKT